VCGLRRAIVKDCLVTGSGHGEPGTGGAVTSTADQETAGTPARILDSAEGLLQARGYNGFSYADVAAELNITTAALHYHFAGKPQLGLALVDRYAGRFSQALAEIEASSPAGPDRLRGYAGLYRDVLAKGRMCLCGMLAAEYQTLPAPMRDAVLGFLDQNETWLEGVLGRGAADGTLRFAGPARQAARLVLASLEGAMLVARCQDDGVPRFESAAAGLLAALTQP
jgi:TetR/AcrR family transcriptional repressor of nem operon